MPAAQRGGEQAVREVRFPAIFQKGPVLSSVPSLARRRSGPIGFLLDVALPSQVEIGYPSRRTPSRPLPWLIPPRLESCSENPASAFNAARSKTRPFSVALLLPLNQASAVERDLPAAHEASSRRFRLPRAWDSKANSGSRITCCASTIENLRLAVGEANNAKVRQLKAL